MARSNTVKILSGSTWIVKPAFDVTPSGDCVFPGSVFISGALVANDYKVVTFTTADICSTGSAVFGDSPDDVHVFTGSVTINGNASVGTGASGFDYSNATFIVSDTSNSAGGTFILINTDEATSGVKFNAGPQAADSKAAIFYHNLTDYNRGEMIFALESTADSTTRVDTSHRMLTLKYDGNHELVGSTTLKADSNPLILQGVQPGSYASRESFLALNSDNQVISTTSDRLTPITVVTKTKHTASPGEHFLSLTSTSVRRIELMPAKAGTEITIADTGGNAGTNKIIISPGRGDNIAGTEFIEINSNFASVTLIAVNSARWLIKSVN